MFHPWRALRTLTHVVVVWARPHPAAPAATDGATVIWLDPRMTQAERRCALTHELVHLEHGHRGCQPPAVEHAVRAAAARQLITLEQLADALPWSMSLDELADELAQLELDTLPSPPATQPEATSPRKNVFVYENNA